MALDAIAVCCLVGEFNRVLIGAKVDKVYQPEKDELALSLRTREGSYKLLLSANPSHSRAHFTKISKPNPKSAPMFCMLLRKHLSGGRIVSITQPRFERIIDFGIESYTELGDLTIKHLIIEIMGRYSNIILTDSEGRIHDSIKRIDALHSSVRQVLPSLLYKLPPEQSKTDLICLTKDNVGEVFKGLSEGIRADKAIMEKVSGISPLIAREVVYRAVGRADLYFAELGSEKIKALENELIEISNSVLNNRFSPCIIYNNKKAVDFSAIEILQYQSGASVNKKDSINEILEQFYSEKDRIERHKQRSAALIKMVGNNIDRCVKKLVLLKSTIDKAKNSDKYKLCGDLIIANIYKIRQGERLAKLENYYEGGNIVEVPLDENLSPQANAQKYYKKYNKAKNAFAEATKQIKIANDELEYLENVLEFIKRSNNIEELAEIKLELAKGGYIKDNERPKRKANESKAPKPFHFISSDGFDIYCGKNNIQNDYLTLKFANSNDLWFHTKNIPGSHTVIKLGIDKNVPDGTILEAANIAAFHSSAKDSSQVPVDYTTVKNVKKPNGAKPGMVIYDHYNTVYIEPDEKIVERLKSE